MYDLLAEISRHLYCEDNGLVPEWKAFRESIEADYVCCPYLNKYIEHGMCYDLQMISGGYIKSDALPDVDVDREKLLNCCTGCKNKL